jgi:flagellar biogenesis protein FliO
MLPQFGAVLAVFALLFATLWFLRKRGALRTSASLPFTLRGQRASKAKLLEQVDRLQLSPTHTLSVIKMGERAILIGTSPAGFCLVESSPWKSVQAIAESQS